MTKKILSILLSIAMIATVCVSPVLAVDVDTAGVEASNYTVEVDKTTVKVGDTFSVTVGAKEIDALASMKLIVDFDKTLATCTEYIGAYDEEDPTWFALPTKRGTDFTTCTDTVAGVNTGKMSYVLGGSKDVAVLGGSIAKATMTATKAGELVFYLTEETSTAAGVKTVVQDDVVAAVVTIEADATPEPTATPTAEPTATPTAEPTATPTAEPTATPTAEPTATPTAEPTATPTAEPTATPTAEPADKVTVDDIATVVAENTAYWGVKILEAAEANITAKFETDTESKEVTLVNAAGLDGNGDLAFNLYLKLTGERVGKAVTATVTVGEDSDSGVWAAAN